MHLTHLEKYQNMFKIKKGHWGNWELKEDVVVYIYIYAELKKAALTDLIWTHAREVQHEHKLLWLQI